MAWYSPSRDVDIKVNIGLSEYLKKNIIKIEIDDALCNESALSVGGIFSAKCVVKLKPNQVVPKNAIITPFCKEGSDSFIKLGEFKVDNRVEEGDVVTLTCFDTLYMAGRQYFPTITFPATKTEVLDDICSQLGILKHSNVILSGDIIEKAPRYESTMREVLSDIAKSEGACIHMSRNNQMQFLYFSTLPIYTIYKSNYSDLQILNEVRSYDNVIINQDSDNEIVSGVKNLRTAIVLELPWATQVMADRIRTSLIGLNYTPCRIVWRGNPNLEIGSRIRIEKKDGTFIETFLLENQYSFTGGLLQTSSSPSNTEQESEFGGFSIKREVLKHDESLNKIDDVLDIEDEYTKLRHETEEGEVNIQLDDLGFSVEMLDPITDLPVSWMDLDESGLTIGVGINELDTKKININPKEGITIDEMLPGEAMEDGTVGPPIANKRNMFPKIFIEKSEPNNTMGNNGDLWLVIDEILEEPS